MVDLGFAVIAATAVLSCHIEADLRVGLFFCLLLLSTGPYSDLGRLLQGTPSSQRKRRRAHIQPEIEHVLGSVAQTFAYLLSIYIRFRSSFPLRAWRALRESSYSPRTLEARSSAEDKSAMRSSFASIPTDRRRSVSEIPARRLASASIAA